MFSKRKYHYPIIVIGAGAGGLVAAIGAAKAGKKVLLVEKGNYGGDCTNFGCIPSKSLIAAAHTAHAINSSSSYGLTISPHSLQCQGALERTRRIVEEVRRHEEPEALEAIGVDTLTGAASFVDPHTLQVALENGDLVKATGEQIVIATGSSPYIPPIPGLQECDYCSNESIFHLKTIPESLAVIGGGPIGCELAQAFQRLGSTVTLLQHADHLLKREELESQEVIEKVFLQEGMQLKLQTETVRASKNDGKILLRTLNTSNQEEETIEVDCLLVSSGRRPNIEELNLAAIGVHTNKRGIVVDRYGRTARKNIWAVGDVAGHAMFTHVAENEGRSVLASLLLPWPLKKKLDLAQAIPRVTYTDPEIASVGLDEQTAIKRYGKTKIAAYRVPFTEVDRAITTGRTEGFVKIVTKKWSSRLIGATIAAPRAGEMLSQLTTAMRAKIPLRKLATLIHPYPTYSLAIRQAADQWLTKTLIPGMLAWKGKKS
ncbi:MAG: FAD-dependent oxidoreductase [Waddliaceae bacterium]